MAETGLESDTVAMHSSRDWAVLAIAIALGFVAFLLFPAIQIAAARVWWNFVPLPRHEVNRDIVIGARVLWLYRRGYVGLAEEMALAHSRPRHLLHALHRVGPIEGVMVEQDLSEADAWRIVYNNERTRANSLLASGDLVGYEKLSAELNAEARVRGLQ